MHSFAIFSLAIIKKSPAFSSYQDKGVSITVVGILGENWKKHEYRLKMKEMAGNKGQVLMYPDFETLTESYDEVLATLCRKCFNHNHYHYHCYYYPFFLYHLHYL